MDTVEKIYPTKEELSIVNKISTCPYCKNIFKSESNLNLHLFKTHKQTDRLNNNREKLYYCPINNCIYNCTTHFRQFKQLKQHYLKVHLEKNYICTNCNKRYPTEQYLNKHHEYCNIWFKCCDCNMSYGCYETLKTHSRRKKHKIYEKNAYKNIKNGKQSITNDGKTYVKTRLILPKPTTFQLSPIETAEQCCQTDQQNILQTTQQTQTIYEQIRNNQTVATQTTTTPKTASCNTTLFIDDDSKINEVGTQTHINSLSISNNNNNNDDYILSQTLDSNYFNCNMETQTDLIFSDELFKCCDDYTNMYTQTCAELFLCNNTSNDDDDDDDVLELRNSHTQTNVFDAVLKSVESQTVMSQSKFLQFECKDISHMETQTEMHFKQILEEINV